jgi:hypothetical protein
MQDCVFESHEDSKTEMRKCATVSIWKPRAGLIEWIWMFGLIDVHSPQGIGLRMMMMQMLLLMTTYLQISLIF